MNMLLAPIPLFFLASFGLAATNATAQEPAATAPDVAADTRPADAGGEAPAELKTLAESCSAHKFETIVSRVTSDGRTRGSRVRICGKQGQTDADWLVTLRDSVAKTEANEELSQPVREQIVAALKAEIASLEAPGVAVASAGRATTSIAISHEPVSVPEAPPQYSSVPPMPAPMPRQAAAGGKAARAPIVPPRLRLSCALPRESFASCARLERETQLMVRADEALPAGISLRFLRGGDTRAELDVGPMEKGGSLRERLPGRVCAGVLRGKVQVQILAKGQVAETLGPYPLYCGS